MMASTLPVAARCAATPLSCVAPYLAAWAVAAGWCAIAPCRADDRPVLCEVAAVAERPAGAPKLAAVCFSSRWKRPQNANDPHDTFQAAEAFHATDFVWIYALDKSFVDRMKQAGGKVYLAINSLVPDAPGTNERLRGRILDLDGNRVTAPWMRGWQGSYWGCANSPEYRDAYVAYARKALDAGTDGLQMDDPPMNRAAVSWGGCFCPHCMDGFRRYLETRAGEGDLSTWGIGDLRRFDYRDYLKAKGAPVGDAFAKYDGGTLKQRFIAFQEQSVREFYRHARARIDAHAGRHVVFSSNNYAGRWQFPYDLFEFGMAELPERDADPKTLYERFADARSRGKAQVFTFVPKAADGSEVALTRRVIAACYACGGHLIVPWDVYTGSNSPRYFGKPEQYADLYGLVRAHARLIEGYEDAAFAVPGLRDERYPAEPPISVSGAIDVAALARAVPGDLRAPVVVHLVDWRDDARPFELTLAPRRFFRQGALEVELLRPGAPPVRLEPRTAGERTALAIPRLDPWGMVVVTAAGASSDRRR